MIMIALISAAVAMANPAMAGAEQPVEMALHAAQPKAVLRIVADANHVLKAVPDGDRAANMASYGDPALPLAPGVAEAIAAFVKQGR